MDLKNLKFAISIIMLFFVFSLNTNNANASNGISIYIDGEKQSYSNQALISNGATLVPLRGIFEALGASVNWNERNNTIDATRGDTNVWLKIGSKSAKVDGKSITVSVPAQVRNGRTLVPLRFISEALGESVKWNGATRTINIGFDDYSNSIQGTYEGWYIANQGKTGLTLRIQNDKAIFKFYPLSNNPDVGSGEFEMEYEYDETTGLIQLTATKWIKNPNGYFTVDLTGNIKNGSLSGFIDGYVGANDYGKVNLVRK